jgi:hypothetical protein
MQVAALWQADPPSKESYRLGKDKETEKAAKVQLRGVELQTDTCEGTYFSSAQTLQNVTGLEVGMGEWKRDW